MSIIVLNANPAVHTDLLNLADTENIETTAVIDLGVTRNDKSITVTVPFTILHGTQLPLYNLRWAKLKADPNWIDPENTKLIWKGLPAPVPPTLPIWVYKLDGLNNVPSIEDFFNALPKFDGLELPDLSKIFSNPFQDISFLFPQININLPDFTSVYNFFKNIELSIADFFSKWPTIDLSKITELVSWINLNGLVNLPKTNPLYTAFNWLLEKIELASSKVSGIWAQAETAIVNISNWTINQIESAKNAIENFFAEQMANLNKIKFGNILSGLNLNLDFVTKDWLKGFTNFGDPVDILKNLSTFAENLSTITVANLQSLFNWTTQKATEFLNYLQSFSGNLDFLKNIWPEINLSFPSLNFQVSLPAPGMLQFPLPGIPLPTPPFVLPNFYPMVQWPSWMTTPDVGIATIPTQIPPGVPTGMPVISTPQTNGVVAFQSLPGFVYSGELQLKTKVNSSGRPTGVHTFDLYLLASSEPTGVVPAGGNSQGAVARVRFTVNFLDPKVAIGVNPNGYNPPATPGTKVVQLLYQNNQTIYDLGVPATKVLYTQGVELVPIQFYITDNTPVESGMPRREKSTYYSEKSVLNITGLYKQSKTNPEEKITINTGWGVNEQEPKLIPNTTPTTPTTYRRHWYIDYIPDTSDGDNYNYFVIGTVIKNYTAPITSDGKLDLSNSGFKDNSIVVASIQFDNTPGEKKFKNLNLPWKSIGELFDEDIRTAPSNEQAYIDEAEVLTRSGYKYGLGGNTVRQILTDEHDIADMVLNQWKIQSFLAFSQIHINGIPVNNSNLMGNDLVTDYFLYTKKPPYKNTNLTNYFYNLVDRVNNVLRSNGFSFRLNKSIDAYLASLNITDLRLSKTYARALAAENWISVNSGNLLIDSDQESISINKLDKFSEYIFIHELVHLSHSNIYYDIVHKKELTFGSGIYELEILTDHMARIIMHLLYPEVPITSLINVDVGYTAFPVDWHTGDKQKAIFAASQTNATNYNQTLQIIKNVLPADYEVPERIVPLEILLQTIEDLDKLITFTDYLDPNGVSYNQYRFLRKYPKQLNELFLATQPYKRVAQGLIYHINSWNINDLGILEKVAQNGQII